MAFGNEAQVKVVINADDRASGVIRGFGDTLKRTAKYATVAMAAATSAAAVFAIKSAAQLEQTSIAFETMLGSADKAKKLLGELSDFAVTTPFTLPEVEQGAKQLLAMGSGADIVLKELKMLGDVSAGTGTELSRLILNFGQVRLQGKLTGRELRDFAVGGVPLIDELSKALGVSSEAISEMTSNGEIGFEEVSKAFKNMTSEGGRFGNLMDRQSKTFSGVVSNIQDNFIRLARNIVGISNDGTIQEGGMFYYVKKAGEGFQEWLSRNRDGIIRGFQRIAESIKDIVNWIRQNAPPVIDAFRRAWEYLEPKIQNVWARIKADLIPAMKELWVTYGIPLAKFLGVTLVVAIGAVLDVLAFLIDHFRTLTPILVAFGALILGAKVKGAFLNLAGTISGSSPTTVTGALGNLKGMMGNKTMWQNALKGGVVVAAIWAADQVIKAFQAIKGAMDQAKASAKSAAEAAEARKKAVDAIKNSEKLSPVQKEVMLDNYLDRKMSFSSGGYTGSGGKNEVAGVVHKGEYVVPQEHVDQQTGMPMLKPSGNVNMTVNIGMFAGTSNERRKIAQTIMKDLADLASQKNMTLEQMLGM